MCGIIQSRKGHDPKRKEIKIMRYRVEMLVDGKWYEFGTYRNRDFANEVAMDVRDTREVPVTIVEVEVKEK